MEFEIGDNVLIETPKDGLTDKRLGRITAFCSNFISVKLENDVVLWFLKHQLTKVCTITGQQESATYFDEE